MKERRIEIAVLVVCVGLAIFAYVSRHPVPATAPPVAHARSALGALPRGATIVVTVDFARLMKSTFGALLTDQKRVIPGVGSLSDVCGFDPTERIRELAFGVPDAPNQEELDVGIVATGDFTAEPIVDCAARVVARRKGTPARTQLGSFVSLRDRANPSGEIAVKNGGPVLLGGGPYLREMVDAAEGNVPSLIGDEAHTTLRKSAGTDAEIVASIVAKPGWLERWVGSDLVSASPLAQVRAAALSMRLEPRLEAVLLLACPNDDACAKLGALGKDLEKDIHEDAKRYLGADPIRTLNVRVEKNAVRATVTFDELVAAQVLGRLFSGEDPPTPAPQPVEPPPKLEPIRPNEVIRPAPSGSR